MRIICCYSAERTETSLLRGLDDDERRLIISCPWQQPAAATYAAIADKLTTEEAAEVRRVFGIEGR